MVCSAEPHRAVSAQDKLPPTATNSPSTLYSPADSAVFTYTTPHTASEPKFQHGAVLCSIRCIVGVSPREKPFFLLEQNTNALINRSILCIWFMSAHQETWLLDSEHSSKGLGRGGCFYFFNLSSLSWSNSFSKLSFHLEPILTQWQILSENWVQREKKKKQLVCLFLSALRDRSCALHLLLT